MVKETLGDTSKLIIPNAGQDGESKEILKSLEAISDEEIRGIGEEVEKTEKNEKDEKLEEKQHGGGEFSEGGDGHFEVLQEVDGSYVEFEKDKRIVKRKGKNFDLNTQSGEDNLIRESFGVMKSDDIEKMISILGKILGDDAVSKILGHLSL